MIDCENEVYTRIVRMLREEFPGINVAGEYTKTPSSFPHVSITQSDNSTIADKQDTSGKEAMSLVMFVLQVLTLLLWHSLSSNYLVLLWVQQ